MNVSTIGISRIDDHILSLRIASDETPYIGQEFVGLLAEAVAQLNQDEHVRAVVVEGGTRYFMAGASRDTLIETVFDPTDPTSKVPGQYLYDVPPMLLSIAVPTIAVMEGHAIGGGFVLGLWCDIPVLAEESLYGMNFMALGFTPGPGSILGLEEALGAPLARELVLTGRLIKGRELKANGTLLAHAVVPRAQVRARALSIAQELAEIPRQALVLLKRVLAERRRQVFQQLLQDEIAMQKTIFSSPATYAEIAERYPVRTVITPVKSN